MKVLSVVGARPQFVKLAPVAQALEAASVDHVIVHTGQHYDTAMSDVFFADLRIPAPKVSLGIGSASHGVQTGAMLSAIEPVLEQESPDWVLVYGDTNSTLAGALAAVKMHLPVAHLEAGLRSFNRHMPEEHNRILTDHAADLLLAPSPAAVRHLHAEGLGDRTVVVGDVMVDVCLRVAHVVAHDDVTTIHSLLKPEGFVVATVHRAENTDDPDRLRALLASLKTLPLPVVLPVHPRLRARASAAGIELAGGSLLPVAPLPYPAMVMLTLRARAVATDSGGLQKEAYVLGTPCTTLRKETEWEETLSNSWNVLADDLSKLSTIVMRPKPLSARQDFFGTGDASLRVVTALEAHLG